MAPINQEEEEEEEEGFEYQLSRSTCSIFYQVNGVPCELKWRPSPICRPILPLAPDPLPVSSSCKGLVACRNNANAGYHVGNPYVDMVVQIVDDDDDDGDDDDDVVITAEGMRYLHLPPPSNFYLPGDPDVVLVLCDPERFPVYHLIWTFLEMCSVYSIHVYRSNMNGWESYQTLDLQQLCIVPNSGVSCSGSAYWLLRECCTHTPTSMLGLEASVCDGEITASISALPSGAPPRSSIMQLGSVRNSLGLIVVHEDVSSVQLFVLEDGDASNHPWTLFESFKLKVVDAEEGDGDDWVASWREEDKTIVCREMPRPIRFESFKVELLFYVQGRVVLLENNDKDPHRYRLTTLPGTVPAVIVDGLPYVCSGKIPVEFRALWRSNITCFWVKLNPLLD